MGILDRTPKVPPPTPTGLYLCLSGYISAEGSFAEGSTLRGSHPAVKARPAFWAPVGLSDEEIAALRLERFPPPIYR